MNVYIVVFRSLRLANYFFDSLSNYLSKRYIDYNMFNRIHTKTIKLVSPNNVTLLTIDITTESHFYNTPRCRGRIETIVDGLQALDKLDELEAYGGNE